MYASRYAPNDMFKGFLGLMRLLFKFFYWQQYIIKLSPIHSFNEPFNKKIYGRAPTSIVAKRTEYVITERKGYYV